MPISHIHSEVKLGLRNRRRALHLGQIETARRAGISQSYLCMIETGRRKAPPEVWRRLAVVLDTDVPKLQRRPYPRERKARAG